MKGLIIFVNLTFWMVYKLFENQGGLLFVFTLDQKWVLCSLLCFFTDGFPSHSLQHNAEGASSIKTFISELVSTVSKVHG